MQQSVISYAYCRIKNSTVSHHSFQKFCTTYQNPLHLRELRKLDSEIPEEGRMGAGGGGFESNPLANVARSWPATNWGYRSWPAADWGCSLASVYPVTRSGDQTRMSGSVCGHSLRGNKIYDWSNRSGRPGLPCLQHRLDSSLWSCTSLHISIMSRTLSFDIFPLERSFALHSRQTFVDNATLIPLVFWDPSNSGILLRPKLRLPLLRTQSFQRFSA